MDSHYSFFSANSNNEQKPPGSVHLSSKANPVSSQENPPKVVYLKLPQSKYNAQNCGSEALEVANPVPLKAMSAVEQRRYFTENFVRPKKSKYCNFQAAVKVSEANENPKTEAPKSDEPLKRDKGRGLRKELERLDQAISKEEEDRKKELFSLQNALAQKMVEKAKIIAPDQEALKKSSAQGTLKTEPIDFDQAACSQKVSAFFLI